MSGDGAGADAAGGPPRWSPVRGAVRRAGRAVFGDRTGLALWLGLVLALAPLWRVGVYINDVHAVANAVVALSEGHLAITELRYPLDTIASEATQPGLHRHDGRLYARNYGQVVAAVPVALVLEGLSAVTAPRLVLPAAWSLGALAFVRTAGPLVGGSRPLRAAGAATALVAFAVSTVVAEPLDPRYLPLVALQATTLAAAAGVGLCLYRLLAAFRGRRAGVAAGVAGALATPVGFWATIPKRHAAVAALTVAVVVAFAAGRRTGDRRRRGLAYGLAGLVVWIHGFLGFVLVAGLGAVDLATARSNDPRTLAVLGLFLVAGLGPALVTNVAVAGDPLQAPRLLPGAGPGAVEFGPEGGVTAGPGGGDLRGTPDPGLGGAFGSGGTAVGGGGSGPLATVVDGLAGLVPRPPATALAALAFLQATVSEGVTRAATPAVLYQVFVRSGRIPGVAYGRNAHETIELTLLESAPLAAGLIAVPLAAAALAGRGFRGVLGRPSPARATDLLVAALAAAFTVVGLSRLPLHSQLTVRYLTPVVPLAVYGVARLPAVGRAVEGAPRALAGGYAVGTVGWLAGSLALTRVLGLAVGEAVQLHALVALVAAAALGVTVAARTVGGRPSRRPVAAALGVAGGVTTAFLAAAALSYFRYGTYALPVVEALARHLPAV